MRGRKLTQAALIERTAGQDAIRSTQYVQSTPPALADLLLSPTNRILIRSRGPECTVVSSVAYTVGVSSRQSRIPIKIDHCRLFPAFNLISRLKVYLFA